MYIDTLAYQTKEFFYSLGFGFILGILYDLTRILRISVYNGKKKAFVFDVIYSAVAAMMSVIFVLGACNGKFAFYVVSGIVAGFAVYQFSLGHVFRKVTDEICEFLRGVFRCILSMFRRIGKFFARKIVSLTKKTANFRKNSKKNHKKDLQEE